MASAVVHWILLSAPLHDPQWRNSAPIPDGAPMAVRLALIPDPIADIPASPDSGARRKPLPANSSSGDVGYSLAGDSVLYAEARALPPVPDPHYYPARDLDEFPRLLTPLRIDRPANAGAGEVRLEILVDEHGVVRDVIFDGSAQPGAAERWLRTALAATHFMPARKDGRAVKSRVMLSLGFDVGNDER